MNFSVILSFFVMALCYVNIMPLNALHTENKTPKKTVPESRVQEMKLVATVEGKQYFAQYEPKRNWTEAKDYCKSLGYSLATITTERQKRALERAKSPDFNKDYWTAGRDAQSVKQFVWDSTRQEVPSLYPFREGSILTCLNLDLYNPPYIIHLVGRGCHHSLGTLCEAYLPNLPKTRSCKKKCECFYEDPNCSNGEDTKRGPNVEKETKQGSNVGKETKQGPNVDKDNVNTNSHLS